jgi:gliding motility-associated-like protein
MFVVRGFNAAGCSSTDSVKVSVRLPFTLGAGPGDSVCLGETVQLKASGADKYQWSPSIGLDNATSKTPKATPSSTTTYTVTGRDNDNCFTQTATVVVKVNPIPTVDAGVDATISVGSTIQLKSKTSPDVNSWNWTLPYTLSCATCADPVAKPRSNTTYRVDVANAGGCTSMDEVTINVICNNGNLYIPNTFSPNNDGMNDRFYPRGTGIARIKSLRIYNRWGEVIFEKINFNPNDPTAGWDGTFKGRKLPPDVFVYTCEVICENSIVLPFKGDVTLIQ